MPRPLETKDLVKMIEMNSDHFAELNAALISTAAIWGVKSSEESLIEIGDILTAKGKLKSKWVLRSAISHNGINRELYTEHASLIKYLEQYLDWRVINKIGITNNGEFRSLDPNSKLFLDPNNQPFKFFRRSASDSSKANLQPAGMNNYFKKLIKNSCITGVTYKDFRHSLAIRMHRDGNGTPRIKKSIMVYLGIRSYDALMKILNADPKKMHELVKGIYNRI